MDRVEVRTQVLQFLYSRYERFGPQPHMISREEMVEAFKGSSITESDVKRSFRELVEEGLAEGHPRPGTGMHPEDGLVWISPAGRHLIESRPVSISPEQQAKSFQRRQDMTLPNPQTRDSLRASRSAWDFTGPQELAKAPETLLSHTPKPVHTSGSDQAMDSTSKHPNEQPPLAVFLCHATGDKEAVRALYRRLDNDGFRPWLDEEDLLPGQDWAAEIQRAVRNSHSVIVCLSEHSITNEGFVQKEIKFALDEAEKKHDGTIFVVPVRLEECVVPDRLSRLHWVDLFDERGYERLVRALRARASGLSKMANPQIPSSNQLDLQSLLAAGSSQDLTASMVEIAAHLRDSKTANVVHRTANIPGSVVPHARLGDKGELGARIANEGPAAARDVILHVTFPDGTTRSSSTTHLLAPDTEISPSPKVPLYPFDFGEGDTRTFEYRITYRDGNGSHELHFRVRLNGTWNGDRDWKTYLEPTD